MKKLFFPLLLLASPALAEPYTYAPKDCEFQITFPEKPFIETKCAEKGKDCVEVATFTKVVPAGASTNFRVTCTPVSAAEQKKYTPAILEETLRQMIKSASLEPYDVKSGEKDGYRSASALSLAQRNDKPLIYNGQLWLGKTSLFTIESEMAGEQNDEIEKVFATVLQNAYPKDRPPASKTVTPKKETATKRAAEKQEKK